jgi:hypothetical protein
MARPPLISTGSDHDNGAVSIHFADATLASAFVARWCVGNRVQAAGGRFQGREDEPTPRVGPAQHSIP